MKKLTELAQYDLTALAALCPHTVLVWADVLPRMHYRGAHADNKNGKNSENIQFTHEGIH